MSTLDIEKKVYYRNRERFIRDGKEGKYVLIKGKTIHDFFDSRDKAESYAINTLHLSPPFLIHKIVPDEPKHSLGGVMRAERTVLDLVRG